MFQADKPIVIQEPNERPASPHTSQPPQPICDLHNASLGELTPPKQNSTKLYVKLDRENPSPVEDPARVHLAHRWPRAATAENIFEAWPVKLEYNAALLGMSGFSTSGYKQQRLAPHLALASSLPVFITALPGHTGRFSDLASITSQQVIDTTVAQAQTLRKQYGFKNLIGMGHSTGALAVLCAHAQQQRLGERLFDGVILTGPPFYLYSRKERFEIFIGHQAYRLAGLVPPRMFNAKARFGQVPITFPASIKSVEDRHAPTMARMPVNAFVCLEKLRAQSLTALHTLDVPTLCIYGQDDHIAHPEHSIAKITANCSPEITPQFRTYEGCSHSGMYEGKVRRDKRSASSNLVKDVNTFIRSLNLEPAKT